MAVVDDDRRVGWCGGSELGVVIVEPYVKPVDGADYCESCGYLDEVWEEYAMDDGSRVVPLCQSCSESDSIVVSVEW